MTIIYSIWQGSRLISAENRASKSADIAKVLEELNTLGGREFTALVHNVEVNS